MGLAVPGKPVHYQGELKLIKKTKSGQHMTVKDIPRPQTTTEADGRRVITGTRRFDFPSLGRHPGAAAAPCCVTRRQTGGRSRGCPDTLVQVPRVRHSLFANRAAVPEHALLEEDWRAFRAVLHNSNVIQRTGLPVGEQVNSVIRDTLMALTTMSKAERAELKPEMKRLQEMSQTEILKRCSLEDLPTVELHKTCVDPPAGFLYRRHRRGTAATRKAAVPYPPPVLDITHCRSLIPVVDPRRAKAQQQREETLWDPAVTFYPTQPETSQRRELVIYNEPDSVPDGLPASDFTKSLVQRAVEAAPHSIDPALFLQNK